MRRPNTTTVVDASQSVNLTKDADVGVFVQCLKRCPENIQSFARRTAGDGCPHMNLGQTKVTFRVDYLFLPPKRLW